MYPGRTSIPGRWEANVNFRYAPVRSAEEAEQYVQNFVNDLKVDGLKFASRTILRQVVFMKPSSLPVLLKSLDFPVETKQTWTDVAQLSAMGVPALTLALV